MNPEHFRARTRIRNGINGPAVSVRIFERIEGSVHEGLANCFLLDLQSIPALVLELEHVLVREALERRLHDDENDPARQRNGGGHE